MRFMKGTDGKRNERDRTEKTKELVQGEEKKKQKADAKYRVKKGLFVCFFLPQVAFVGCIFDMVTDVVVHSMSCCAVSSIKHLRNNLENTDSLSLSNANLFFSYTVKKCPK